MSDCNVHYFFIIFYSSERDVTKLVNDLMPIINTPKRHILFDEVGYVEELKSIVIIIQYFWCCQIAHINQSDFIDPTMYISVQFIFSLLQ